MQYAQGIAGEDALNRAKAIMDKAGLSPDYRAVVKKANSALEKCIASRKEGNKGTICAAALETEDGIMVNAHNSPLMHAGSALILNALKAMAGISKEENLISPQIIDAITKMKRDVLRGRGVSLNIDEILICLAMSSTMNENAEKAMTMLPNLTRAEVHFTHIPSAGDMIGLRKLGINVTSEPKFPSKNVYNP